jgi:hypothetical protein
MVRKIKESGLGQKHWHARVKAMTLQELIVVLILTSLIIGLGFSVLTLVRKQMWGIDRNYATNTQLNLLRQALWMDMNQYHRAELADNGQELTFYNEMGQVAYWVSGTALIREKDTFELGVRNMTGLLHNTPVRAGAIDALELEVSKGLGSNTVFVFKAHAADFYMD